MLAPLKYRNWSGWLLLILFSLLTPQISFSHPVYPEDQRLYDLYPWSVMVYAGITASDALAHILLEGDFHRWPEHLESIEFSHTLSEDNPIRKLFSPIAGVFQIAINQAFRVGDQESTIYEVDPYFNLRWANLPWNHYINTSFAIGEGISYATAVPTLEKKDNSHTKRLLNYLMLEFTLAMPCAPRTQLVFRIHHRSGAYGLYHAGNTGSNNVGIGLRVLF
jgi:hypothetical protein